MTFCFRNFLIKLFKSLIFRHAIVNNYSWQPKLSSNTTTLINFTANSFRKFWKSQFRTSNLNYENYKSMFFFSSMRKQIDKRTPWIVVKFVLHLEQWKSSVDNFVIRKQFFFSKWSIKHRWASLDQIIRSEVIEINFFKILILVILVLCYFFQTDWVSTKFAFDENCLSQILGSQIYSSDLKHLQRLILIYFFLLVGTGDLF